MLKYGNYIATYKYVATMPPAKASISDVLYKVKFKHHDEIIEGKTGILISPVYFDSDKEGYFQPIFDLDRHKGSIGIVSLIDEGKRINDAFKSHGCHYELTKEGLHVVCEFLVRDYEFDEYKNILTDKFKSLDTTSTFRDMPIWRVGSYSKQENFTVCPATDIDKNSYNKCEGKPNEIMEGLNWNDVWDRYLFPRKEIANDTFKDIITSI